MTDPTGTPTRGLLTRLFDIRNVIAALLGLYGIGLLIAGLLPGVAEAGAGQAQRGQNPIDMAAGSSANLWVGAGLLLFAVLFAVWAALTPARSDSSQG
ncbi:putative protein OS=Tsukamurella paurometabola (strain ATCC 8368 / DSM / CCUG 35730 /CIP 100753 / JCM 10117 / KCTC 9821 / NBRC 16120 / NCIMB 702349/ NCTC 13040) OX=521096 GN=Tpau_0994 PE=4 SV=1 [Tsukamurella paurometabola]|uniref:Uncharacterized protein n=1 Tax=Tsukamurella paurometabola (strain ATCC 8368 / DSM 20162 / CCUG 35730 / CIP 100753 / JCM 10117 / KCTC 9821 / NBRC 16120 / NCIMB 702349 / NCTC 13040) TaxID=521096 RepID=D5UV37_TSUPD|nr:hypothetical protein [Tsukamurella paurometabola]ADG77627.1 conserved hypothetical protein [Tsukamurella paurometabola DSM 20162]SUP27999.1 Uncharacterised protein [Tsukamurella paurometabola]